MKRLDEIFNICYGSQLDLNKCEICGKNQGFNFVNRSNSNCGVSARIQKVDKKEPFKAGSITVAMGGSVLSSFVQQEDFYTGQNVKVLVPIDEMNLAEKLFYCQCIEANRFRFSTFGREANYTFNSLLVPSREEIPIEIKKKPIANPFCKTPLLEKQLSLQIDVWQWFELGSIFEIKKGKRLTKADMEDGQIPYIGAIDSNNGVSALISNNEHLHDGNTISVSYNGSIAEAFYQKNPFWATDDVNVLYSARINCYTALFVTTIIHREKYRFNYGRKWDLDLMKKSRIKLPAINTGEKDESGKPIYEPDWQFMEDYIKSLPYSACL
ncbi:MULTISPECIES: restriction endonuclease subunit S [unclassified Fibrobacter]|uniref:restriction endonuclease subunit S n=1 Tax=unclassified Fibrobacter TaxID=2634177 RepID=UPI0013048EA5|nr:MULTISPECIES: restriction endonuclease subunit S [unclassified Fibrobacter]